MTPAIRSIALTLALLGATPAVATASFANRSIGLEVGGFKFGGDGDLVDYGIPISLTGSFYIDSSFVFFLHGSVNIFNQRTFVTGSGGGIVLGGGGQVGLRYLFLEESIRPYADLYVAVLGIGRGDTLGDTGTAVPKVFLGPGAAVGVDFFIADSISLGPRGFFDLFITLNFPPRYAVGGAITASTYF